MDFWWKVFLYHIMEEKGTLNLISKQQENDLGVSSLQKQSKILYCDSKGFFYFKNTQENKIAKKCIIVPNSTKPCQIAWVYFLLFHI